MTNQLNKKLVVCDLDNTLYDWVGYFINSFYAMVDETIRITNCDREELLDDLREVHKKHHDSEHPFALLETRTIRNLYPSRSAREIAEILDPAFHAFNRARKQNLRTYSGVRRGLTELRRSGVSIVAHTESRLYAVVDRLGRLDLAKFFNRIYCRERPDSEHPEPNAVKKWLDGFPMHLVVELSHHQRKPDPNVLIEICCKEGVSPEESAYVGDSLARDIFMAQMAGVYSIWAKYGVSHTNEEYERLVRVTHWTQEDVIREKTIEELAHGVEADFVLHDNFTEILGALDDKGSHSLATTRKATT